MVNRLNVCRITGRSPFRFAIILQADEFTFLDSRLVAPLVDATIRPPVEGIHPSIEVDGTTFLVRLDQIAPMPMNRLGEVCASVSDDSYAIQSALDRLFATV